MAVEFASPNQPLAARRAHYCKYCIVPQHCSINSQAWALCAATSSCPMHWIVWPPAATSCINQSILINWSPLLPYYLPTFASYQAVAIFVIACASLDTPNKYTAKRTAMQQLAHPAARFVACRASKCVKHVQSRVARGHVHTRTLIWPLERGLIISAGNPLRLI